MKHHGEKAPIGSVTTPIKRALVEMLYAGALINHRKPAMWVSINGRSFYERTAIAMVDRNLAVVSAAAGMPGAQFLSLTQIGRYVATAVDAEIKRRVKEAVDNEPKRTARERSGHTLEAVFAK